MQLYLAMILLVSFRFTHVYVVFLLNVTLFGFYVDQVARSQTSDTSHLQSNINLVMTLIIVLLWFAYIYIEELYKKLKFVFQTHAIKEYQKL